MGRERRVEPRLSGQWDWQECWKAVCNPAPRRKACDTAVEYREEALRQLGTDCTDAATDFLESETPQVPSDLAAAYYVSALHYDRPADLLRAYDAAIAAPPSADSWFNRSLIEEALGLPPSWDKVALQELDPEWRREVELRLKRASGVEAAVQWDRVRRQLPAVLRTGDAAAAEKRIRGFPGAAQKYLEEELPLDDAGSARTLAEALFRVTKDPYAQHIAGAWQQSVSGMAEYRAARAGTSALYEPAARLLKRARNPLHLAATMRHGIVAGDVRLLLDCQREAEERGYRRLLGDLHSARAYVNKSAFPEAIAAYERSATEYLQVGDHNSAAGSLARKAGIARAAGNTERALREIRRALQYRAHLMTSREYQNVYGEAGQIALRLGHRQLALAFQNVIIAFYQRAIARTPPEQQMMLSRLRTENGIAYTHRAGIYAALGDRLQAGEDLQSALSAGSVPDPQTAALIAMRRDEMTAQTLMGVDPTAAAEALGRALQAAGDYPTYRASLYIQRANAYRQANQPAKAAGDLRQAIAEINKEEEGVLVQRKPGEDEELWTHYFARFQDAYHDLIRYLLEEKPQKTEEAFQHIERARAYETLDLLMRHGSRRERIRSLRDIQKALPPDTAILEYAVLDDRVYVWVITSTGAEAVPVPASRKELDRWSEGIRQAGNDRDALRFDALISKPPAQLLPRLPAVKRLVVVPGVPLHVVPFIALRNPATGNLLLRDYILETAPSAALYAAAVERNAELGRARDPSILVIGNPEFDRSLSIAEGLPDLEFARREAEGIAALYARSKTLIGAEATVDAFFRHAEGKDIIHFAGHGVVKPSALLLARSANDDGALYAEELLTRLKRDRTRLVVLSACSTAGGLPIGPEGVAPLVRPIISAGVPAIIGTLWNVHDATAKELLVSFHQHYRQTGDAAAALRAAQLELAGSSDSGKASGVSWAPFQVIGHHAPTHENDKGEPP